MISTARNCIIMFSLILCMHSLSAEDSPVMIELKPAKSNPGKLIMGNEISFESDVTNVSAKPIDGMVVWISLIEITPGNEQPMDLEDWSAQKAISQPSLKPGKTLATKWPMRLIQSGDYRVIVSLTSRNGNKVFTSPAVDFHVNQKPVISSLRVIAITTCIPLIFLIILILSSFPNIAKK